MSQSKRAADAISPRSHRRTHNSVSLIRHYLANLTPYAAVGLSPERRHWLAANGAFHWSSSLPMEIMTDLAVLLKKGYTRYKMQTELYVAKLKHLKIWCVSMYYRSHGRPLDDALARQQQRVLQQFNDLKSTLDKRGWWMSIAWWRLDSVQALLELR